MKFGYSSEDVGYGQTQNILYLKEGEKEFGVASCPMGNFYFKMNGEQLKKLKEDYVGEKMEIKDVPKNSKKSFKELSDYVENSEREISGKIVNNFLKSIK